MEGAGADLSVQLMSGRLLNKGLSNDQKGICSGPFESREIISILVLNILDSFIVIKFST